MKNLPNDLQFTDEKLQNMTIAEMRDAFASAEKEGVLDEFTKEFWKNISRVRSKLADATVTNVLRTLEDRKRALGRKYDALLKLKDTLQHWTLTLCAIQYNDLEYQIRWLCNKYALQRRSKPYLLNVV